MLYKSSSHVEHHSDVLHHHLNKMDHMIYCDDEDVFVL